MKGLSFPTCITANDRARSATTGMIDDLVTALKPLRHQHLHRMLDVGCGFGGLARFVADDLGIPEVHGIDRDGVALLEARQKGLHVRHVDVSDSTLPFPNDHFDLITSFGMLDYLSCFDFLLRDIYRVTRPGGYSLISLPNLGSWHNRLLLLLGYQPRDVEISQELLVGVNPWYLKHQDRPTGHLHTVTTRGFAELMAHHGFAAVALSGARPDGTEKSRLIQWVDWMFTRRATLARRFFFLGAKDNAAAWRGAAC